MDDCVLERNYVEMCSLMRMRVVSQGCLTRHFISTTLTLGLPSARVERNQRTKAVHPLSDHYKQKPAPTVQDLVSAGWVSEKNGKTSVVPGNYAAFYVGMTTACFHSTKSSLR